MHWQLTNSWCVLLSYKSKSKLRPIALRDCISKVLWVHLLTTNKDQLQTPGGSYARKGGCAAVALAVQLSRWLIGCLDILKT